MAIVKYKTNLKRPRYGVCTRWLADLQEGNSIPFPLLIIGDSIPVRIVEGGMRIPKRDVACIFVGPGTGIAPMRAMIEERTSEDAYRTSLRETTNNRKPTYLRQSKSIKRFPFRE